MADVRTQQARERAAEIIESLDEQDITWHSQGPWEHLGDACRDGRLMAEDALYLADRVAALETALRPFQEFASHAVETWEDGTGSWLNRMGHERICDWFGPTDFAHVAALAGSGTEPPQEQPTAPCYVCGHPVAEGEGWRRDSKTWCPWHHDLPRTQK